jgi:hypothetical protein
MGWTFWFHTSTDYSVFRIYLETENNFLNRINFFVMAVKNKTQHLWNVQFPSWPVAAPPPKHHVRSIGWDHERTHCFAESERVPLPIDTRTCINRREI